MADNDDDIFEIEDLNLEELDVEQLEERLELAIASPLGAGGGCTSDTACTTYDQCSLCSSNCYNGCNGLDGC